MPRSSYTAQDTILLTVNSLTRLAVLPNQWQSHSSELEGVGEETRQGKSTIFSTAFFLSLFILWGGEKEKEKEREKGVGRGRERERENSKQVPHCQCRAPCGARTHKPRDHDLSQNQELDAQSPEPPRCPASTS